MNQDRPSKIIQLFLTTIFICIAFTANCAEHSIANIYKALQESPFDLMYINDSSTQKEGIEQNYKINGFGMENALYFGYNPSDLDNIRLDSSLLITDTNKQDSASSWSGLGIRYKRKSLLSQEKHGVSLNAELRVQYYNPVDRAVTDRSGYISPRLQLTRSITDKFTLTMELRDYEYFRMSSNPETRRRQLLTYLIPSYALTDKLSITTLFHYNKSLKGDNVALKSRELFEIIPSIGYTFSSVFYAELYWDAVAMQSSDHVVWIDDWSKKAAWGVTAVVSLF